MVAGKCSMLVGNTRAMLVRPAPACAVKVRRTNGPSVCAGVLRYGHGCISALEGIHGLLPGLRPCRLSAPPSGAASAAWSSSATPPPSAPACPRTRRCEGGGFGFAGMDAGPGEGGVDRDPAIPSPVPGSASMVPAQPHWHLRRATPPPPTTASSSATRLMWSPPGTTFPCTLATACSTLWPRSPRTPPQSMRSPR